MTAKILAFANQKGGVGKTTSCVNLAASLALLNKRVLLCDLDPQGNATMGSGVDKSHVAYSMNDMLLERCTIQEAINVQTPAGYDVIAANSDLTEAEVVLVKSSDTSQRLKKSLHEVKNGYDFIFLDCPPSLNMLTVNGLGSADGVIIAMQCEYFALEGLSDLLSTISQLQSSINPKLEVFGLIRTMFDARNRLASEVSSQLIGHFGNKVFQTVIPRNVRLAEAPSYGLPVHLYDRSSRGSAAYMALASEVLRRARSNISEKEFAASPNGAYTHGQEEALVLE